MGHYATLLMAGREIRKRVLRAFWIFQNNVMKMKKLCVSSLFYFYNCLCSLEKIHLKLTINIIFGRNDLTKRVL